MQTSIIKNIFHIGFLLSLFFSTVLSIEIYSQEWIRINPIFDIPGVFNIQSSFFFDKDTGFIAATTNYSTRYIFKTTDGGLNWRRVNTGPHEITNSDIQFINKNIGWISGTYNSLSLILKTTDGGNNWEEILSPRILTLNFFDELNGIAGGWDNIFKTVDGGRNWVPVTINPHPRINDIYFINDRYGWAVGQAATDVGSAYKTVDGGNTWQTVAYNMQGIGKKILFTDSLHGFIAAEESGFSSAVIQKTTDAGNTWEYIGFNETSLSDINFTSTDSAWVIGSNGLLYMSADSGNTWQKVQTNTNKALRNIHFFEDGKVGYILGDSSLFLKYDPYGITPVELTSFQAISNKNYVELKWITATETNNKGFEIERASFRQIGTTPGQDDWNKIAFIMGAGTTIERKEYLFIDKDVQGGNYFYKLKQIDFDGSYNYSQTVKVNVDLPVEYFLEQNYPNPFNPQTKIKYTIPQLSFVTIKIYDLLGRELTTHVNEEQSSGNYEIEFNAKNLSSGIYIYSIKAGNFIENKKMTLIK